MRKDAEISSNICTQLGVAHSDRASMFSLVHSMKNAILVSNKTRQGYVLRNTLKLAGYFILASKNQGGQFT